jgi:transcriptional regulator with XRE-family HTH domain
VITKKDRKLAKQLRRLRKKNKLTQEKVAEQLKVTPKYIQYLESSRRVPSLKLLYRIADLFEVKMKDLFPF